MAEAKFVVWNGKETEKEGPGPDPGGKVRGLGDKGASVVQPGSASLKAGQSSPPDPEVVERASRRRFTAEYKMRIVREAQSCGAGELGALLRREGLYSSNLHYWRRQVSVGQLVAFTSQKRGRKRSPVSPPSQKVLELERDNERLRQRLKQAEEIIELQKKISEIVGISMRSLDT